MKTLKTLFLSIFGIKEVKTLSNNIDIEKLIQANLPSNKANEILNKHEQLKQENETLDAEYYNLFNIAPKH